MPPKLCLWMAIFVVRVGIAVLGVGNGLAMAPTTAMAAMPHLAGYAAPPSGGPSRLNRPNDGRSLALIGVPPGWSVVP